jgi:hypothetical protein
LKAGSARRKMMTKKSDVARARLRQGTPKYFALNRPGGRARDTEFAQRILWLTT